LRTHRRAAAADAAGVKSVLSERRDKTLAFWHDRTTPQTPQASKALRELFMSKKKAAANAWPLSGQ